MRDFVSLLTLTVVITAIYAVTTIFFFEDPTKLILVTLGLILSVIAWTAEKINRQKKKSEETEERLNSLEGKMNTFQDNLGEEISETHHIKEMFEKMVEYYGKMDFSKMRNTFAKNLGENTFKDILKRIEHTNNGFSYKGEELALFGYIEAWKELVEKQKHSYEPLHARMIHASDIKYMKSEDDSLYIQQEQFIKAGGQAERILIGEDKQPNEDYQKAMDIMEGIGIKVMYLPFREDLKLEWDFFWVEELELVMKWESTQRGKSLSKCEVDEEAVETVKDKWDDLKIRCDRTQPQPVA